MLPLDIFSSRLFTATNAVTFAVYAALGGVFFFLVLRCRWSPASRRSPPGRTAARTVILLLLSARAGALASRIGPRLPMTVGPVVAGLAVLLMSRLDEDASYLVDVLPAAALFGLGMALTVAPLTATVLAAAPGRHAGLASGVNNAVARVASLLAVAVLPLVAGLDGAAYADPQQLLPAYRTAMSACAVLLLVGGTLAALTVRPPGVRPGVDVGAHTITARSTGRRWSLPAPRAAGAGGRRRGPSAGGERPGLT